MSGLLTRPAEPTAPGPVAANGTGRTEGAPTASPPRDSLELRLVAFAALSAFGGAHWVGLVADPPQGRTLLLVAFVTAGAAVLGLLHALPGRVRFPLAAAAALAMLVGGLVIAGLEARLLLPGNWAELADGLDRGLGGIQTVNWPYGGDDAWIRRTILLGTPLLLVVAAAAAFWPVRGGAAPLRAAGLVTLLVLYGTAVTEHDPGRPVLRGLLLLVLVATWLWLPRLEPREALTGAAAVFAVGLISIPLSAGLDADQPWWDYRAWNWFGGGKAVTFDWRHSYGPLDWPRDGTTLLQVRSRRPNYWKAETLDRFDGFRWLRSGPTSNVEATRRAYGELPSSPQPEGRSWDYFEYNPRWDNRIRVTVRALRSDLIVGAGTTYRVSGAGGVSTESDGTTAKLGDPLEKGDSYEVRSYAPDPTPAQMRGAPDEYSDSLSDYASIVLPRPGETALDEELGDFRDGGRGAARNVVVPALRNSPGTGAPDAEQALLGSPYARMYRLAGQLTAGAPSTYAAVRAVEAHLKRNYRYNERPPSREVPLAAFLFEDKIGYCQQFSGAMALMLRMSGIPARVATGFTRGSYNRDTREYRVRDLDAHSWVEVHFTGIGWVTFDPTPAATPAEGQAPSFGSAAAALSGGDDQGRDAAGGSDRSGDPDAAASSGGGAGWRVLAGLALVAALVAAVVGFTGARSRRALEARGRADAQLMELRSALARLGWSLPAGTTLLALEARLRRAAGPSSAGYVAALRADRYDPRPPGPPGRRERRALRRELGAVGGLRGRLRALIALPPGRF